jgi:serine/threonine protein phosphatase PrpC
MQISWISRQGTQRSTNNDAAAIAHQGGNTIALLVDAAEKGQNGQALAKHWATTIVAKSLQLPHPLIPEQVIALMHEEQGQLRHNYLHEIASYCFMHYDVQSTKLWVLTCGDCLTGTALQTYPDEWIYQPHTLNYQPSLAAQSELRATPDQRHLLTQCLNARRFHMPQLHATTLPAGASIQMCTDGYWLEHLEQGGDISKLDDDASVLKLETGMESINAHTDSDNLFILQSEPTGQTKDTP